VSDAGILGHVSASQVKTYRACKRQWWYEKVARLPKAMGGGKDTGTALHHEMRAYLAGEIPASRLSPLAAPGVPELPLPGTTLAEHALEPPPVAAGLPWTGSIDWLSPPQASGEWAGIPWVGDHKTTKNYTYCLDKEELAKDVQMISYAYYASIKWSLPESGFVRLTHVYYHTDPGPRTKPIKVVDTKAQVATIKSLWGEFETVVQDMKATAKAPTAAQVEGNAKACWNYGGCPYRSRCPSNKSAAPAPETPEVISVHRLLFPRKAAK